jgi:hypothetical protein
MVDLPDGHDKEISPESTDCRTDHSLVSHAGLRRHREETGPAPILLRYWDRNGDAGPFGGYDAPASIVLELPLAELAPLLTQQVAVKLYRLVRKLFVIPDGRPPRLMHLGRSTHDVTAKTGDDLSHIILELPLSELARFLPQRLAVRLCNLARKVFAFPEVSCFPCALADLTRDRDLLAALRGKLAHVRTLTELIADPPVILIDEGQKLFFYRGISILLRPASFSYVLILARTPGQFVMRERIYRHLWPGEMNYEGSNQPYERQITDHKRRLIAEIRNGITGRVEIQEGEMEALIATRHRMGYMLNFSREHVLILGRKELLTFACLILWDLDRFFMALLLDTPELFLLW